MEITWNISQLECIPDTNGLKNYVVKACWECNGAEESYFARLSGVCEFSVKHNEFFTLYPDLTEMQVLGWIWASDIDKIATETAVAQQIEAQKNPPVVSLPLPWNSY